MNTHDIAAENVRVSRDILDGLRRGETWTDAVVPSAPVETPSGVWVHYGMPRHRAALAMATGTARRPRSRVPWTAVRVRRFYRALVRGGVPSFQARYAVLLSAELPANGALPW